MKFTAIEYQRPSFEDFKQALQEQIQKIEQAQSVEEQMLAIEKVNALRSEYSTQEEVASVRHTIDTRNPLYEKEQNYYDKTGPEIQGLSMDYYRALVDSKFRSQLEEHFGSQLFTIAELATKSFKPEIISDRQEENRLASEYTKLIASAEIEFDGKKLNLAGLEPYTESPERETRKKANEAKFGFFAKHQDKLDDIFNQMVKVRTRIAQKLGYNNFVELAYVRLQRSEYNAEQVAQFREAVLKYIVPISNQLRERQAKRIGLDKLKYYDLNYDFATGNPAPKGDPDWIIEQGKKMYDELSDETREFFNFMLDNEMMDLVNKEGKASGGYCTMLPKYKSPFIFSNFNGTRHDIDVLTHEAGHAFQVYSSRNHEIMEYHWPTYEACEIHSMSMEFFTWPWMELFFKEDLPKYKFAHLSSSLLFIPYGVSVDQFQHKVYENPDMTPAERRALWREIEQKYTPYKDYDGNEYLENGGFWQRQGHIYKSPFYYIDYTLAQICAFQFWLKMQEDWQAAWGDYLRLCKAGGSLPFLQLVELAGLKSPFEPDTIQETMAGISSYLNGIDDSSF